MWMQLNTINSYKIISDIIFNWINTGCIMWVTAAVTSIKKKQKKNELSVQTLKSHWKQQWRQMSCEPDYSNKSGEKMTPKA